MVVTSREGQLIPTARTQPCPCWQNAPRPQDHHGYTIGTIGASGGRPQFPYAARLPLVGSGLRRTVKAIVITLHTSDRILGTAFSLDCLQETRKPLSRAATQLPLGGRPNCLPPRVWNRDVIVRILIHLCQLLSDGAEIFRTKDDFYFGGVFWKCKPYLNYLWIFWTFHFLVGLRKFSDWDLTLSSFFLYHVISLVLDVHLQSYSGYEM